MPPVRWVCLSSLFISKKCMNCLIFFQFWSSKPWIWIRIKWIQIRNPALLSFQWMCKFLSVFHTTVFCSQVIDAHMTAMQNKWSWLLQLTLCLETHLKYSDASHRCVPYNKGGIIEIWRGSTSCSGCWRRGGGHKLEPLPTYTIPTPQFSRAANLQVPVNSSFINLSFVITQTPKVEPLHISVLLVAVYFSSFAPFSHLHFNRAYNWCTWGTHLHGQLTEWGHAIHIH